jgi:hypothetical protein
MNKKTGGRIAKARSAQAPKLDLSSCGLTEIPGEVLELTWLSTLNLEFWRSRNPPWRRALAPRGSDCLGSPSYGAAGCDAAAAR